MSARKRACRLTMNEEPLAKGDEKIASRTRAHSRGAQLTKKPTLEREDTMDIERPDDKEFKAESGSSEEESKPSRGRASGRGRGRGRPGKASPVKTTKKAKTEGSPKPKTPRKSSAKAEATPEKKGRKRKAEDDTERGTPAKRGRGRGGKPITPKRSKFAVAQDLFQPVDHDPMWDDPSSEIQHKNDAFVASKELIRAVLTNNIELAKKILTHDSPVASLSINRSADIPLQATDYALMSNNMEMLALLDAEQTTPTRRAPWPAVSIKEQSTGQLGRKTFRFKTAAITGSRGGKEGNAAFLHDGQERPYLPFEVFASRAIKFETVKLLSTMKGLSPFKSSLEGDLGRIVQFGNIHLAGSLLKHLVLADYGFNNLHLQTLTFTNEDLPTSIRAVSVTKKPYENLAVTPLHCSCINPNPKYLKTLLQFVPNIHQRDGMARALVHYAAACSEPGPLQYLFDFAGDSGVLFKEGDSGGTTPLMIASMVGALENIKILFSKEEALEEAAVKKKEEQDNAKIENGPEEAPAAVDEVEEEEEAPKIKGNKAKPKKIAGKIIDAVDGFRWGAKGFSALHYAVHYNHLEVVQYLLTKGAPLEKGSRKIKLSPLHIAAQQGHMEIAKALLEAKAKIDPLDGKKRTPLMLAAMNGHLKMVSYLIHMGADFDAVDSSKNSVTHYAGAYGWDNILAFLIKVEAKLNIGNDWKVTPLACAVGKGHMGCASLLLDQPSIDINAKNDEGCTLLADACKSTFPITDAVIQNIEFLLSKKSDPLIANAEGYFPIHHLALKAPPTPLKNNIPQHMCELWKSEMAKIGEQPQRPAYNWRFNWTEADPWGPFSDKCQAMKQAFEVLLKHGCDIDQPTIQGAGKPNPVQQQTQQDDEDNEEYTDSQDETDESQNEKQEEPTRNTSLSSTSLDLAVSQKSWEIVKFFLDKGARISPTSDILQGLFQHVPNDPLLCIEILNIIKTHEHYEEILNRVDDEGYSPLLSLLATFARLTIPIPSEWEHVKTKTTFARAYQNIQDNLSELISQFTIAFFDSVTNFDVRVQKIAKWRNVKDEMEVEPEQVVYPGLGFAEGSSILLHSGKTQLVQDIKSNNSVKSFDSQNGTFPSYKHLRFRSGTPSDLFVIQYEGGEIRVHPTTCLYVFSKGWSCVEPLLYQNNFVPVPKPAEGEKSAEETATEIKLATNKLAVGDIIFTSVPYKNRFILKQSKILNITKSKEIVRTYSLEGNANPFFCESVLVRGYTHQEFDNFKSVTFPPKPKPVTLAQTPVEKPPPEEDRYGPHGLCTPLHFIVCVDILSVLIKLDENSIQGAEGVCRKSAHPKEDFQKRPIAKKIQKNHSASFAFIQGILEPCETVGADLNILDGDENPAYIHLLKASFAGKLQEEKDEILSFVESCVKYIDLNQKSHEENTPIHIVAQNTTNANERIFKILLPESNLNTLTKYGTTVLNSLLGHCTGDALILSCLDEIIRLKKTVDVNSINNVGHTALYLAITKHGQGVVDRLLKDFKADPNQSFQGEPLIQIATKLEKKSVVEALVIAGADVNVQNTTGDSPLHSAAAKRNEQLVQFLLSKGANPNHANSLGQTSLHYAANFAVSGIDSSFQIERNLIDAGADVNSIDKKGRTPLHYAFISIGSKHNAEVSKIDPVVTASGLCSSPGAQVDVPDKFGKTPLHYCAARASTICSFYLLKRGAELNRKDRFQNTPLGIGLWGLHPDYAIMLIQQPGIDISSPIIFSSKTVVRLKDSLGFVWGTKKEVKEWQWTLFRQVVQHEWTGVAFTLLDTGFDFFSALEDSIVAQKLHFMNTILERAYDNEILKKKNQKQETLLHLLANSPESLNAKPWPSITKRLLDSGLDPLSLDQDSNSVLHNASFRHQEQLLLHLIPLCRPLINHPNKHGCTPLIEAVRNAKTGSSLKTLQTLLGMGATLASDKEGQTPLSILLDSGFSHNILEEMEILLQNKVSPDQKSAEGNPPLTEILRHHKFPLLPAVLSSFFTKAVTKPNADVVDKNGDTPLAIFVRKISYQNDPFESSLQLLIDHNANLATPFLMNPNAKDKASMKKKWPLVIHAVYSFPDFKFRIWDVLFQYPKSLNYVDSNGQTALMLALKEKRLELFQRLVEVGADPNIQDKFGENLLMQMTKSNNLEAVKILAQTKHKLDLHSLTKNGKSIVHLVVNPLTFGSYENVQLLDELVKLGANVNQLDSFSKPPLYYAELQDSGTMAKALLSHGAKAIPVRPNRESSILPAELWESEQVSVDEDFQEMEQKIGHAVLVKYTPKPDSRCNLKYAKVYSVGDVIYDISMTKTDIKYGDYGLNNFYIMQVLHEPVKDIYLLLNRWGRIGEDGQVQRTPMGSAAEAATEFAKIFKSKTGNAWPCTAETFNRVPKKWTLQPPPVEKDYSKMKLETWDLTQALPSKLPEQLQSVLAQFTEVKLLNKQLETSGIDLPLTQFNSSIATNALLLLSELMELCKQIEAERLKPSIEFDLDLVEKCYTRMDELSNDFYTLIPFKQWSSSSFGPLNSRKEIEEKIQMLSDLSELSTASKVLMAATIRMDKFHPLDYVYRAVNCQMEYIHKNSEEFKAIERYASNTSRQQSHIVNLFKIQRKGEPERIEKWKSIPNHFLLWHGSRASNFLGILSEGLRVAPPTAPVSGYAFGKGIYFADMIQKSEGYCHPGTKGTKFLLLAEVALGNIHSVQAPTFSETLPEGFHSCKGVGLHGPDFQQSIVLPNGVTIPTGTPVRTAGLQSANLNFNEYIVYDNSQVRLRYLLEVK